MISCALSHWVPPVLAHAASTVIYVFAIYRAKRLWHYDYYHPEQSFSDEQSPRFGVTLMDIWTTLIYWIYIIVVVRWWLLPRSTVTDSIHGAVMAASAVAAENALEAGNHAD
jgi:hypothetical protein